MDKYLLNVFTVINRWRNWGVNRFWWKLPGHNQGNRLNEMEVALLCNRNNQIGSYWFAYCCVQVCIGRIGTLGSTYYPEKVITKLTMWRVSQEEIVTSRYWWRIVLSSRPNFSFSKTLSKQKRTLHMRFRETDYWTLVLIVWSWCVLITPSITALNPCGLYLQKFGWGGGSHICHHQSYYYTVRRVIHWAITRRGLLIIIYIRIRLMCAWTRLCDKHHCDLINDYFIGQEDLIWISYTSKYL